MSSSLSNTSFAAAEFKAGRKVLIGSVIGVGIGGPGLAYYTWGVFLNELEGAWGWSRTQLSAGMLLFTLVVALISPFVGGLVDRHGVRGPIAMSLCAILVCYIGFYLFLNSLAAYFILQICLAACCAPSSPLAFTRAVSDWFDKSRGLALGLVLIGTGIGAALAPAYVSVAISEGGWRAGYLALAILVAVAAPLVIWQVRLRDPSGSATQVGMPAVAHERSALFRSARGTRTFWMLIAAFFVMAFGFSGLIIHFVPLLTDRGLGKIEAAAIAGLIGMAVIAGRLVTGFCVDRFFAPNVAAVAIALSALGCLALALFGTPAAPLAAIAIGLAAGAEVDLIGFLTSRYFPMPIFGRVYGWQYGAFAIGNGLSPLWIAMVYDRFGSYHYALFGVVGLLVLAITIFLNMPAYSGGRPIKDPI